MFVQSARFVEEHKKSEAQALSIHGVEKVDDRVRLCRLNLAVHGLEGDIRHGGEINSYYDDPHNTGSSRIEQLFLDLLNLTRGLTEEETRHVREQLSEEELVVFDLLTRPGPELSTEERDEVKKVTRQLLARLRSIFTVDWQKTAQARARIRDAIDETLDEGLPRAYTPDLFKAKATNVFQHVYEHFGRAA